MLKLNRIRGFSFLGSGAGGGGGAGRAGAAFGGGGDPIWAEALQPDIVATAPTIIVMLRIGATNLRMEVPLFEGESRARGKEGAATTPPIAAWTAFRLGFFEPRAVLAQKGRKTKPGKHGWHVAPGLRVVERP
jgi:hypothetical protein